MIRVAEVTSALEIARDVLRWIVPAGDVGEIREDRLAIERRTWTLIVN